MARERVYRHIKAVSKFRKRAVPVILLHILKRREGNPVLIADIQRVPVLLKLIDIVHKLQKEKSHRSLVDTSVVALLIHERPHHILDQILYRKYVRDVKMQISRLIGIVAEGADYEFSQHILLLHHIERHIKKFRSDNEVHRNVILARRKYLMIRKLIEEEKIPLF